MSYGEDFLRALLNNADPEALKAFVKDIQRDKPPKREKPPEHGPIKTYTTIIKKYTCLACGSRFSARYEVSKGEQVFCLDEQGTIHYLTVSGKPGEVILNSCASKCMFCRERAANWSKEELIEKWLALVKSCSFKEVVQHRNSILEKKL